MTWIKSCLRNRPMTSTWADLYVTGWDRILVRVGRLRIIFGRRTRSRVPVRVDWMPRLCRPLSRT